MEKTATVDLKDYIDNYGYRTLIKIVAGVNSLYLGDECDIAIDNFIVRDRPACFDISVSSSNASCSNATDASAQLIVNPPSTTGLTFNWSTGDSTASIQNLGPGNYTVTATDNNGCTATKAFTVYAPRALNAELYITPASSSISADGRVFAQVSGGRPPYQLQWLNGHTGSVLNNASTGYEALNITDANGCTLVLPTFVPIMERYTNRYNNFPYNLSFDGNLGRFKQENYDDLNWLKRSSSTPTNGTGPAGAAQGSHFRYLEASGNGSPFKVGTLLSKRYFNITRLTDPELYFQYHMEGNEADVLFVQTSIDGGFTWRENIWTTNGNQGSNWQDAIIDLSNHQVPNLLIRIVGRTGAGELSDIAIDDLQIRSATVTPFTTPNLLPDQSLSVSSELNSLDAPILKIHYYPNPVKDQLQINWEGHLQKLELVDPNGRKLEEVNLNGQQATLQMSQLPSGIYFLRAKDALGQQLVHKVFKY